MKKLNHYKKSGLKDPFKELFHLDSIIHENAKAKRRHNFSVL